MDMEKAWKEWWESLEHVSRCNRDTARTREAFEAGYLAASEGVEQLYSHPAKRLNPRGGRHMMGRLPSRRPPT